MHYANEIFDLNTQTLSRLVSAVRDLSDKFSDRLSSGVKDRYINNKRDKDRDIKIKDNSFSLICITLKEFKMKKKLSTIAIPFIIW